MKLMAARWKSPQRDSTPLSTLAYWKTLGRPGPLGGHANPAKPWKHIPFYEELKAKMEKIDPAQIYAKVDMDTLKYIIRHKQGGSAPGLDDISYETIQSLLWESSSPEEEEAQLVMLDLLLAMINTVLETGVLPDNLKVVKIVPVFKTGDPRLYTNYRGITLLSVLYKLVTSVISYRLLSVFEATRALSQSQAGAMPGYTAPSRIATLKNVDSHAKRNGKPLHIFGSDIQKAFDKTLPSKASTMPCPV
jgi:hypothetical protein